MNRMISLSRSIIVAFWIMCLICLPRIALAQNGCTVGTHLVASCAATSGTITAMRAADFLNTIGSNGGVITLAQANSEIPQLQYAGITRIRISAGSGGTPIAPAVYVAFCKAGIHIDLMANWGFWVEGGVQAVVNNTLYYLNAVNPLAPGCIDTIEGINEPDINPALGSTMADREAVADAISMAMWTTIKPLYPNIHIALWAAGGDWNYTTYQYDQPNMTAYADYCNMHDYYGSDRNSGNTFYGGDNPGSLSDFISCQTNVVTNKQAISTEFGWSVGVPSPSGPVYINADAQAKMDMSKILDHVQLGMPASYVFVTQNTQSTGWGLFDMNGNALESAIALHNLTSILADRGAAASTFKPTTITADPSYLLGGLSTLLSNGWITGHFILVQRSDGVLFMLLWNEADVWNYINGSENVIPPNPITLNLPERASGIIYDPFGCGETQSNCNPANGINPVSHFNNVFKVPIKLTDHLIIVEITSAL